MKSYVQLSEAEKNYMFLNSHKHTLYDMQEKFNVTKGAIYHFIVTKHNLPYKKAELNRYKKKGFESGFEINFNNCPITGFSNW